MTLSELLSRIKPELDESETPVNWSEAELAQYLAEAEAEACLRARLLRDDSTAGVAVLDVTSGSAWIALHSSTIRVLRAKLASAQCPLGLTDPGELDRLYTGWESQTGTPCLYYLESNRLRLIPKPELTDTLYLSVYRTPLVKLSADANDAQPEIAEPHHLGLTRWAIYRALSKRDEDSYDPGRAGVALQQFEREFGPRPSARAMRQHLEQRPHITRAIGF